MKINSTKNLHCEWIIDIKKYIFLYLDRTKTYSATWNVYSEYFKRNKEGHPDLRGDLSLSILPRAIALANHEVEVEQKKLKKCGQYF